MVKSRVDPIFKGILFQAAFDMSGVNGTTDDVPLPRLLGFQGMKVSQCPGLPVPGPSLSSPTKRSTPTNQAEPSAKALKVKQPV